MAPRYYIVGGVQPSDGAMIARSALGVAALVELGKTVEDNR